MTQARVTKLLLNLLALLIGGWVICGAIARAAAPSRWTISGQMIALAPNAGGQDAYSIRAHHKNTEYTVFSNSYLMAGSYPLTGGLWGWRFPICDESCWWQFHAQLSAGVSNAGPLAEALWGTIIPIAPLWLPRPSPSYLPAFRIDFATQAIVIPNRVVLWSYPLWVGVAIPF